MTWGCKMSKPIVAAILSAFIVGLGQVYNGRLIRGLMFAVMAAACLWIGLRILFPLVWAIAILDAYLDASEVENAGNS